jgi:NAD(P)-dependent dehydrogenase (short-subunit alcohol dehydrogenase family)
MAKSVAIVTGASQGIGRSTVVRLACDFSALVLGGSPKGLFRQILSSRAASESDLFCGRMATLEDVSDILVA